MSNDRPESDAGDEWVSRTARRIVELDPDIGVEEARRIAADMRLVERLAAMEPDAAVDFVQDRLAAERPDKYERRSQSR